MGVQESWGPWGVMNNWHYFGQWEGATWSIQNRGRLLFLLMVVGLARIGEMAFVSIEIERGSGYDPIHPYVRNPIKKTYHNILSIIFKSNIN